MKAKCYKWVIGRAADFYSRNDGRLSCVVFVGAWAIEAGKKSPAKLAGLRYERGARKSLQPGLPGEGEAAAVYSRMVRMSFSNWLRRWVKRAAAAPLITR